MPKVDFRVPEGMTVLPINRKTGMRASAGEPGVIMEAFKPGTGPADSYQVIGMDDAWAGLEGEERANAISPQAGQAIRSGGGGLY
jgi:penicillin-binding protein 1A